jgi:hypothetical protein
LLALVDEVRRLRAVTLGQRREPPENNSRVEVADGI